MHTEYYIPLWVANQYLVGVRLFTVSKRVVGFPGSRAVSFHEVAVFNEAAGDIWCQDNGKDFPWRMKAALS